VSIRAEEASILGFPLDDVSLADQLERLRYLRVPALLEELAPSPDV
jgi:hypothetical protein